MHLCSYELFSCVCLCLPWEVHELFSFWSRDCRGGLEPNDAALWRADWALRLDINTQIQYICSRAEIADKHIIISWNVSNVFWKCSRNWNSAVFSAKTHVLEGTCSLEKRAHKLICFQSWQADIILPFKAPSISRTFYWSTFFLSTCLQFGKAQPDMMNKVLWGELRWKAVQVAVWFLLLHCV